jgi:hypothetical protein
MVEAQEANSRPSGLFVQIAMFIGRKPSLGKEKEV